MRCLGTCPGACGESASELAIKPKSPGTKLPNQFSLQDVNPSSAGLLMEFAPARLPQALARPGAALAPASQFLLCCQGDVSRAFQPQSCLHCCRGWHSAHVLTLCIQQFSGQFGILEEESYAHAVQHLNSAFLLLNVSQTGEGSDPRSNYHRKINPLLS